MKCNLPSQGRQDYDPKMEPQLIDQFFKFSF